MKSLSTALSAALGAPVQKPAILVEAHFASTRRWSSHAEVTWGGHTWAPQAMRLDSLLVQPFQVSGTLVLRNDDDAMGTLVLTDGVHDRRIVVWGFDAAATASGDVVWLADAVGAAADVTAGQVRITLRHRAEFVQSPRTYVGAAAGFNHLLPAGTVLRINGIDMRLDRR
jgi:hypothetical protein